MVHLGQRLKSLRKSKGESQQELATVLSMSTANISNIEANGKTSEETLSALCKHYKVSKEWLVNGIGEAPKGLVIPIRQELAENPWKDALVQQLKEEVVTLKQNNTRLLKMLERFTGGNAKQNFLNALTRAGVAGKQVSISGARVGA